MISPIANEADWGCLQKFYSGCYRKLIDTTFAILLEFMLYIHVYTYIRMKLVRVKKGAIIVKIFVYLGDLVFVSLQAYMGEKNHCLNHFHCLTLPDHFCP